MLIAQILTRADVLGGAQSHVRDLSVALRERGHEVVLVAGPEGVFSSQMRGLGFTAVALPHLARAVHPYRDARALAEMRRALRDLRPDLVCTHTAKAGMVGRAAARMLRIPATFTPHGWSVVNRGTLRPQPVFRAIELLAERFGAHIVNVCESERTLAMECGIGPRERMHVVYNGIPDIPEALRARADRQPPSLAMIARYEQSKDHATVLSALAGLRDMDWRLTLVGEGEGERRIREQADELGLRDRVSFLPATSDVAAILAASQVFVLASNFEAFPISILEAMRAGLPVVATDTGGVGEGIEHGSSGLLVPRGDVQTLRQTLALLIGNPGLRQTMGASARARYEAEFTVERMVTATLKVYQTACGRDAANGDPRVLPAGAGRSQSGAYEPIR